uniref:WxxW domain-containing protein n=1 Tax=Poecilia reticulata TaxID=8081 RepID=A0A3P9NI14_POERE
IEETLNFDEDNPSGSGDWETLSSLCRENPGKICPQPDQYGGQDSVWAYDRTSRFVCRKRDQRDRKCHDYKVCFGCSFDTLCWTKWYNRDRPTGSGDWGQLSALRKENPGGDLSTALGKGFVCHIKDHRFGRCRDYKVRFGCSCRSFA